MLLHRWPGDIWKGKDGVEVEEAASREMSEVSGGGTSGTGGTATGDVASLTGWSASWVNVTTPLVGA